MKRTWFVVLAILVVGAGGFAWARFRREPASSDRMRTARVSRGTVVLSVSATGTVQPASLVEVRSRATGTVTRVRVDDFMKIIASDFPASGFLVYFPARIFSASEKSFSISPAEKSGICRKSR